MSIEHHLGGCYLDVPDANTFMPDVWQHIIDKYGIKSILDVGCGVGYSTAWFHERGYYAIGVEGWPDAIAHTKMPMQRMIVHDYTRGPLVPVESFDLAWCAEFVEHVEEQFVPNFMASFQKCRYVCMTHGEPGQIGHHHVNCQTDEYWIEKMAQFGFKHDPVETAWLRSTDVWKAGWGRRTLMFFTNSTLTNP